MTSNPSNPSCASNTSPRPIHMREIPCEIGTELWCVSSVCAQCQYGVGSPQCAGCKTPRLSYLGAVENIVYMRTGFELQTQSRFGCYSVSDEDLGVWTYTSKDGAARALYALTGRTG